MGSLTYLAKKEYPGRVIMLGRDRSDQYNVAVYIITGRSKSSQQRKCVLENDRIETKAIGEAPNKEKNQLLLYDCIDFLRETMIISNGMQTAMIKSELRIFEEELKEKTLEEKLRRIHQYAYVTERLTGTKMDLTMYEPDKPYYTSRISGIIEKDSAGMSRVRKEGEEAKREYHDITLHSNVLHMLSTYSGKNCNPPPPSKQIPIAINMEVCCPKQTARQIYHALEPTPGKKDLRVATVAVFHHKETGEKKYHIVNRCEQ